MSAKVIQFTIQANAQQLIQATNQSAQNLGRLNQATTQSTAGLNNFGRGTTTAAQGAGQLNSSATQAGAGMQQMGQGATQAATGSQRVGAAIQQAGAFIAATVGGVASLVSEFTGLERAQFQVQRAQDAYNRSLTGVQAAQNTVNKLIETGKTDTPAYALAVQKLGDAQDKSRTAEERLQLTQTNLNERMLEFAGNIIPDVIQVVTGAIASYQTLSNTMKQSAVAQEGVTAAMTTAKEVTAVTTGEMGGLTAAQGAATAAGAELGTEVNNVATAIGGVNDTMLIGERATKALAGVSAEAAASVEAFGGAETIAATQAEVSAAAMTGESTAASRDAIAFNQAVAGATRKAEASAVSAVSSGRNAVAMEAEAAAARTTGAATSGLSGIFGTLGGKLGIIGAILAVVGGALLAFAHNIFGFRDGINAVGVSLGNAVPQLRGFLSALQGAGNFITQVLGGKIPQAAEKTDKAVQKMASEGESAADQFAKSMGESAQQIEKDLEDIDKAVDSAVKDIVDKLNKGFEEGPKAFRKAVADIQKEIGFNLPKSVLLPLTVQAEASQINQEAEKAFGVFMGALQGGATHDQMRELGSTWIADLQAGMADQTPAVQAEIQKVIDDINAILEGTPAEQFQALKNLPNDIKAIGSAQGSLNDLLKNGKGLWGDQADAAGDAEGAINNAEVAAAGYGRTVGYIGGLPFLPISEQEIVQPWNAGTQAASTYQSGIQRANQASKDFGTQVGESIGKGIQALQTHAKTWQQTFANMWESAKAPGNWADQVAGAFADEYQKAKPHIDQLQLAAGAVFEGILGIVDRTLPQILSRLQGLANDPAAKNIFAGVLDAANSLGATVSPLIVNFLQFLADQLSTFDAAAAFDSTVQFFVNLPSLIVNALANLPNTLTTLISEGLGGLAGLFNVYIVAPLLNVPSQLTGLGAQILNTIVQAFASFVGVAKQLIADPILAIPGQLTGIGAQILNAVIQGFANFTSLVNQVIITPILAIPGQIAGIGQSMAAIIIGGMTNLANLVNQIIVQPLLAIPGQVASLGQAIAARIAGGFTVFANLVNQIIIRPILNIPNAIGNIGQAIAARIGGGLTTFANLINQIVIQPILQIPAKIGNIGQNIAATIGGGLTSFANVVQQVLVQPLLDIPTKLGGVGKRILDAISAGLKQAGGFLSSIFSGQEAKAAGGNKGMVGGVDPTTMAAAFQQLALEIQNIFAQIVTTTQQQLSLLPTIAQTFATAMIPPFQTLPGLIAPILGQLIAEIQNVLLQIPALILPIINAIGASFNALTAAAAPAFGAFVTFALQQFQAIQNIALLMVPQIGAAFATLADAAAPAFGTLATVAQQVFNSLAGIATTSIGLVGTAFARLPSAVAPAFGTIGTIAQLVFRSIATLAASVIPAVVAQFNRMAQQSAATFNTIRAASIQAFNAVGQAAAGAASRVSSGMNAIAQSASRAIGVVNQLRNAINSLQNKTVTITVVTVYRTVFAQHGGLINAFNQPEVVNSRTHIGNATVGEHGKPELVIPLTKNTGNVADKKINLSMFGEREKSDFANTRDARNERGRGSVSIKGTVRNAQPIIIQMDRRTFMSVVQQQLLEFSDADQ